MWTKDFAMGRVEKWPKPHCIIDYNHEVKFHGWKLSRKSMSRFRVVLFFLNLLFITYSNLSPPHWFLPQDTPPQYCSSWEARGKLTKADITPASFLCLQCLFQNHYLIVKIQYILIRKYSKKNNRKFLNIHNPTYPEVTSISTLVYRLCFTYGYRLSYKL